MPNLAKKRAKSRLASCCAVGALLLMGQPASAQEIIDNGTILLGIQPEGNLVTAGRGLTFLPTDSLTPGVTTSGEALAPGCDCEGWGVADLGGTLFGTATEDNAGGTRNLANAVITAAGMGTVGISGGRSATSNVDVTAGGATALQVEHAYAPSANDNLYQVDVTITNVSGTAVAQLVYRRAMDWDIPPTEFSEFVTIQGAEGASRIIGFSDNGFQNLDPNVALTSRTAPLNTDFVDDGPSDHGAVFDFDFGNIPDGGSAEFTIYYGAAASEADALAALGAVGAEVYSLGQPSPEDEEVALAFTSASAAAAAAQGPVTGAPNTFIFAFAGVGGTPLGPSALGHPLLSVVRDLGNAIARQHRRGGGMRMDGLDGGGAHRGAGYTPERDGEVSDAYGISGLRLFATIHSGKGNVDDHGSNIAYDHDVYTLSVGGDKSIDLGSGGFLGSAVVGGAVHISQGDGTGDNGEGSVEVDSYGASLYGGIESNSGFYADASVGYTRLDYDVDRIGLTNTFSGDTDGSLITGNLRAGFDFPARLANPVLNRSFTVGPYASLSYANVDIDGFTENNNGLRVDGFDSDRLDAEIGVRGQFVMEVNGAAAFVKGHAGYRHDVLGGEENVGLTTVGGATGTQRISETDDGAISIGVGLGAAVNDALTFSVEYDGLFGKDTTEHGVLGRARLAF